MKINSQVMRIGIAAVFITVLSMACSKNNSPEVPAPEIIISPAQLVITADRLSPFIIEPEIRNMSNPSYKWVLNNEVIAITKDLRYYIQLPGNYKIILTVTSERISVSREISITIRARTYEALISKVFDFLPAPGQLVNEIPSFVSGDTRESMIAKANNVLAGQTAGLVSLGGYGGYIVFGFDHLVWNKPGGRDFTISGNAQDNYAEPGIIEVAIDANGNGIPDDEWFEIAGSEYNSPSTIHDYRITYTRPDPLNDSVYWTDNQGKQGKIFRNIYHIQDSYYPQFYADNELVFAGTMLSANAVKNGSGNTETWALPAYGWGYADNHANLSNGAALDIDWAVDASGNKVNLQGIHFVKVYTGVNENAGWLGEASTEISGAKDINLDN